MKMKLLAGPALAALIAATPVLAQDAPPPPPPGHDGPGRHAPMPPLTRAEVEAKVSGHFAMLDLNHDGVLTRGEIVDARDAMRRHMMKEQRDQLFDRLDKNKDGRLSRDEFATPPAAGPEGARPPGGRPEMGGPGGYAPGMGHPPMHGMDGPEMMMGPHWFERADADHDGKLTLVEAKVAALAMFDKIDTNHDGVISPEERRAAMRMMMRDRPGREGWGRGPHEGREPGRGPGPEGGPDGAPPPQN